MKRILSLVLTSEAANHVVHEHRGEVRRAALHVLEELTQPLAMLQSEAAFP
jgi:hypothetical protein